VQGEAQNTLAAKNGGTMAEKVSPLAPLGGGTNLWSVIIREKTKEGLSKKSRPRALGRIKG